MEKIRDVGLGILNKSVVGDEKGEYTYIRSNGNLLIDYVIAGKEVRIRR